MKTIFYIIILIFLRNHNCSDEDIQLKQAIKNDHRSEDEKNRDKYRNPTNSNILESIKIKL